MAVPPKKDTDRPAEAAADAEQRRPTPRQKAVALRYDPKREEAPRVVASGKGHVAEQIVRIALDHGVTIRKDADLVEILSKLDLDALIPVEAFTAVAEILSYIYRTQGRPPPE